MIKLAATGASEESSRIILVQLVQNWHEERSHPHRPGRQVEVYRARDTKLNRPAIQSKRR